MLFLAALHQTALGDRPPPAAVGTDAEREAARAIIAVAPLNEAFFDRRWTFVTLGPVSVEASELALDAASLAAVEPPDYDPRPRPTPDFAESWRSSVEGAGERRERVHRFCRWAIEQLCRRYEQTSCFLLPTPCLDMDRLQTDLDSDGITLQQKSALRAYFPAKQDLELELHFALREPTGLRPNRTRKVLEGTATLDAEWEPGKPMRGSVEEVTRKVDWLEDIPLIDF